MSTPIRQTKGGSASSAQEPSQKVNSIAAGQSNFGKIYIKLLQPDELSATQRVRLENLIKTFRQRSGDHEPSFVACLPGRVNLIGDHVDYHGFSVLPMAIENSTWLCCSLAKRQAAKEERQNETAEIPPSGRIKLLNGNQEKYADWSGELSFSYGASLSQTHEWQNYFLCGLHGVLASHLLGVRPPEVLCHAQELATSRRKLDEANSCLSRLASTDLCVLVSSDLPAESGLSSSSALVCGSALVTSLFVSYAMDATDDVSVEGLRGGWPAIDARELANSCAKFEHLIGTQGGGMDQAVIMTAQEGFAKYVEFVPELRCENVRLPENVIWLVSHCGASYPKAATTGYNTRVLETKLGASMIAKSRLERLKKGANNDNESLEQVPSIELDKGITLNAVRKLLFPASLSAAELVKQIRLLDIFEQRSTFTVDEVCTKLNLTREELCKRFNTSEEFLKTHLVNEQLHVLDRCEHVLEEADRVERFKSICDTSMVDIAQLGQLMTQSHQSLRDKYDCSHPSLDRLVAVALEAGALGSRLTGAGWGGCIVTLVEASKGDFVFERLSQVSKFTFRTEPRAGCRIIQLSDLSGLC